MEETRNTELTWLPSHSFSSSDESVTVSTTTTSPTAPLTARPFSHSSSSSSSSDLETLDTNSAEEDKIVFKLKSNQVFEQEEAVISLRNITRSKEETRVLLCTPKLLSALRSLIVSRYATIQVHSMAALVNLSLEDKNKVKIVRSGLVPLIINVLKRGSRESRDHAAGALFSLSLSDQNKIAIGVLGALAPLLHALTQSDSELTRNDSALALYHLFLVESNKSKLVRLGSVHSLLGMVKSGCIPGRVMLVIRNLATCVEGRAALLDSGGVECIVGMLRQDEFETELTRKTCVAALFGLSQGGFRFKGLAKEAGAEGVLKDVEKAVKNGRMRERVRRILDMMKGRDVEVDWEELLNLE